MHTFQKVSAVFWPAFIVSVVASVILFSIIDPLSLFYTYDISRLAIYSISFLFLWLITALSSAITLYFIYPCKSHVEYD